MYVINQSNWKGFIFQFYKCHLQITFQKKTTSSFSHMVKQLINKSLLSVYCLKRPKDPFSLLSIQHNIQKSPALPGASEGLRLHPPPCFLGLLGVTRLHPPKTASRLPTPLIQTVSQDNTLGLSSYLGSMLSVTLLHGRRLVNVY